MENNFQHINNIVVLLSAQGYKKKCQTGRLENGRERNAILPFPKQPFQNSPQAQHQPQTRKNLQNPRGVAAVRRWLQPQECNSQRYELDQQKGSDWHENWGLVEGQSASISIHIIMISS